MGSTSYRQLQKFSPSSESVSSYNFAFSCNCCHDPFIVRYVESTLRFWVPKSNCFSSSEPYLSHLILILALSLPLPSAHLRSLHFVLPLLVVYPAHVRLGRSALLAQNHKSRISTSDEATLVGNSRIFAPTQLSRTTSIFSYWALTCSQTTQNGFPNNDEGGSRMQSSSDPP